MTKQELLKQADYSFQRGNRDLAKKYLTDFLAQYPNEESAWMLMARIVEEPERKIKSYQRALKINPNNSEAKIWLARIKFPAKNLPQHNTVHKNFPQAPSPFKKLLHGASIFAALAILLGSAAFAAARSNPESEVGKLLISASPTPYEQIPITGNVAEKTRAEMSANYPQQAPLVDALLGFAINSAEDGLEGAPERPGTKIAPSDVSGAETKAALQKALPQPGSLSSTTLSEMQATSWLAMEMKNNPDLPLSDVQVYLRDGKIQIWGMVSGSKNSTAALIVGNLEIDANKNPKIEIESIQIGTQNIPDMLVSQTETWLNQMLTEQINQHVPGLEIMNININSGLITISGMR